MFTALQRLGDSIGKQWCSIMHPDPMWPVCGTYQCPRCQRRFPVPWEETPDAARKAHTRPDYAEAVLNPVAERLHA
jgi:hypothetical protein